VGDIDLAVPEIVSWQNFEGYMVLVREEGVTGRLAWVGIDVDILIEPDYLDFHRKICQVIVGSSQLLK
jgi:hypothetical protein